MGANNESQLSELKPDSPDETMGGSSIIKHLRKIENIAEKIMKIGCGAAFSLALTDSGKLIGWGQNDEGQLGRVTTTFVDHNFGDKHIFKIHQGK